MADQINSRVRALNRSGRTFAEEIGEYEAWVRGTLAGSGLSWDRVAVCERSLSAHEREWQPGDTLTTVPALSESRFAEILASATKGWANFTGVTIDDGTLIVALEWYPSPDGALAEGDAVYVNYSGIDTGEIDRLTGRGGCGR
jgi:hypothetical protein